jgi:hypothetical protein
MTETWQTTWLKAQLVLFGVSIMAVCTAALLTTFG